MHESMAHIAGTTDRKFQVGQPVVYRVPKQGTRPGPRAKNLRPARHGESYAYEVDKYWTVVEILPQNRVMLVTRRGKTHAVGVDDPLLRPASWWERWFYRAWFPADPPPR